MQGVCVVKDFFTEGIYECRSAMATGVRLRHERHVLPAAGHDSPNGDAVRSDRQRAAVSGRCVSNPEMDEQELYDIAYYELRNKLQSIRGVIAPAVYGGKLRRILAYVDAEKLERTV